MPSRHVGILVNERLFRGIPIGRTGHESLKNYELAGKQHDLVPCFFRMIDLRPGSKYIRAYTKKGRRYVRTLIPLPKIIHNRGIWKNPKSKHKLLQLERQGNFVFNLWNRYGKLHIHSILMEDIGIRPHLPHTVEASLEKLYEMMEIHSSIIIKPNSGSIGRGVMKLERIPGGWELDYPLGSKSRKRGRLIFVSSIPHILRRTLAAGTHLLQQRLPLASCQGRPFDLRVSVQKNESGQWGITGICAKLASKKAFLTNVAQGATVYGLDSLLEQFPHLNPQQVVQDIADFSLRVALQLERRLPHAADFGLDIGITDYGFPMFIECNGRDQRYSFKEAGLYDEWLATYSNPLGYAKHLYSQHGQ
jgi:hypothetical protein